MFHTCVRFVLSFCQQKESTSKKNCGEFSSSRCTAYAERSKGGENSPMGRVLIEAVHPSPLEKGPKPVLSLTKEVVEECSQTKN